MRERVFDFRKQLLAMTHFSILMDRHHHKRIKKITKCCPQITGPSKLCRPLHQLPKFGIMNKMVTPSMNRTTLFVMNEYDRIPYHLPTPLSTTSSPSMQSHFAIFSGRKKKYRGCQRHPLLLAPIPPFHHPSKY